MTKRSTKVTATLLAATMAGAAVLPAYADEVVDNLRYQQAVIAEQQAQAINERDALRAGISELEMQKSALLDQIDTYDAQLVTTIATIETVEKQITQKERELKKTAQNLKQAQEDEQTEYAAMRKRIQYMYEEGGNLGMAGVMFGQGKFSDVINKVIYTQKMYEYDRTCLASYTEAKVKVTALQKQQQGQKAELVNMKREQESVKENLEQLKEQARLASEDYEAQIAYCEDVAAQYQALIDEQYAQIWQLQAMEAEAVAAEQARIAAAEAAARQAEAEAAAAAAAQQAAAAQVQDDTYTGETYADLDGNGYADDYSYDYSAGTDYTADAGYADASQEISTVSTGSGIGSDIATFAQQFVGNPYVWGGTSLTNGCDCSGFVQQVFANYGINLSRTTYTQANEGTAVSYSDMQPGDVINYGGHTAIYIGDNQIVHAADESTGIIVSNNPAYQPIVTIRRFT